ncbi:MAG: hypothetical protein JWO22_835 [Frankiales bacterium]|nr:hypothetical protein [Frankiales bacterium]
MLLCAAGAYTDIAEGLTAWHWFLLLAVTVFVVNGALELRRRYLATRPR